MHIVVGMYHPRRWCLALLCHFEYSSVLLYELEVATSRFKLGTWFDGPGTSEVAMEVAFVSCRVALMALQASGLI